MSLIKFFIAGLTLSSGPCLLFCAPVVLSYVFAKGSDWREGLKISLIFSFARLLACSVLGFLAVALFKIVLQIFGGEKSYIRFLLGVFVVLMGFFYLLRKKECSGFEKFLTQKKHSIFLIGLLIGFSPCAPFLAVLTYIAATAKNVLEGFLSGFAFGLGTVISPLIPLSMTVGFFSQIARKKEKIFYFFKIVSALVLIYFGISLILFSKNV